MIIEPRATAVAESYPTFWDTAPKLPPAHPVLAEDAYTAFVTLAEDDFPDDVEDAGADPNGD